MSPTFTSSEINPFAQFIKQNRQQRHVDKAPSLVDHEENLFEAMKHALTNSNNDDVGLM